MKVLVPTIFLVLLRWSEAASSPFDKFDATKGGVIELRFPDEKAEVSLVSLSNFFETVVINGTIHSVAKIADSKSAAVVKTKSGKSIQTDCKEEKEDDQIRELCSINVVKGTSTAEIFNALLKEASKKTKAFGGVEVKAESAEAADAILNALASNEISVKHLELYYGKAVKPNEKSLLTLVKASKLSQIYAEAPAWKVTDEFFQNEGIQKLGSIELKVAESQIKDKTIAKFNGDPSLQLGKTPNLTQGGVRAFLQPVFNYKSHGRLLVISPKFKLNDKALLKGRKFKQALETKNPGSVTRNLDVQVGRARPAGLSITTEGESLSFSVVADT